MVIPLVTTSLGFSGFAQLRSSVVFWKESLASQAVTRVLVKFPHVAMLRVCSSMTLAFEQDAQHQL